MSVLYHRTRTNTPYKINSISHQILSLFPKTVKWQWICPRVIIAVDKISKCSTPNLTNIDN